MSVWESCSLQHRKLLLCKKNYEQPQLVETSAETERVKIEQDTVEVEAQKEVCKSLTFYLMNPSFVMACSVRS